MNPEVVKDCQESPRPVLSWGQVAAKEAASEHDRGHRQREDCGQGYDGLLRELARQCYHGNFLWFCEISWIWGQWVGELAPRRCPCQEWGNQQLLQSSEGFGESLPGNEFLACFT